MRKAAIYALKIPKLQADANRGIMNSVEELTQVQPGYKPPATEAATLAQLCTHWLHERGCALDTKVPVSHWGGPHVLCTTAQYLRQPIVVISVGTV
ncbi:hypothetical protein PI125_g16508 [Phytophthora idaei]|nr:hypothetical protein PI125_g16508 [Phytophthora idaei]